MFHDLQEATSLGVLPSVSFNKVPILFDTTELPKNVAEVNIIFFGLVTFPNIYLSLRLPSGSQDINSWEGYRLAFFTVFGLVVRS